MGDIKRKRRLYSRPRKLFDKVRIDQEKEIVKEFGLKNKKEIWKAKSVSEKFRKRAKELISKTEEEKKNFVEKLNKRGLSVNDNADVLGLTERDILERRLQTILFKKKMANTPKQARQLIVHRHIKVGDTIVNKPSFWITKELENEISIIPKKEKDKKVEEGSEALEDKQVEEKDE
jgi:small subunit ribosomal protein S4